VKPEVSCQRLEVGESSSQPFRPPTRHSSLVTRHSLGFTLLELLIVVGIIGLLMVLTVPAFTTRKSADDVTSAAYGISAAFDQARAYAKANNTYVFVGLAEVDDSVSSSVSPQVAGYGRVAVAIVASKDGTRHFEYKTNNQGNDWTANYNNGANLTAVGKLRVYENLHFRNFPSWTKAAHPNSNMARSQNSNSTYNLSAENSTNSVTPFTWPVGSSLNSSYQYSFDKVINFDPHGVARIATATNADEVTDLVEIAFQQTHGTVTPTPPTNQDAGNHFVIQIDAPSGAVRLYRP
jgi:prepilin-type N-terminal cleavage/methylation domain-containing protein